MKLLTDYEEWEIFDYPEVYFVGKEGIKKI